MTCRGRGGRSALPVTLAHQNLAPLAVAVALPAGNCRIVVDSL
jgi:hypothetical protein